jgi:ABC-type sulfate transport system permease component
LTFGVLAAVAAAAPASDDVTPGVLGFLVVAAMGVALFFLVRSMNKQFRKIAPEADKPAETTGTKGPRPAQAGPSPRDTPE